MSFLLVVAKGTITGVLRVHSASWIPPFYLGRLLDTLDTAVEH